MPIRLLTPETIGKIAAGEVVERPVSVVKELIENALDAEASRIDVRIEDGGGTLIRVTDDGLGMSAEDLGLAVQRHATSKLSSFDDLETIDTLGFRGEALPSIGAVSQLGIRTVQRAAASGTMLDVDFGTSRPVQTVAASPGTTVSVRDLFGNVPARRKFLRRPGTEASYITRMVGAYACNRSDVQWTLIVEGRKVISTTGNGNDSDAALGVYGNELSNEVLLLASAEGDMAVPGIEVSGWVSSPRVTRSHRQNLVFFINGRLATHRSLVYALEDAFHSLLMVGRHPIGMVRIELDPAMVDVNVHPSKAEVKFVDERLVCRAVQRAAHQALTQQPQDVLPEIRFSPPSPAGNSISQAQIIELDSRRSATPVPTPGHLTPESDSRPLHPTGVPMLRVLGQVSSTYIIAEGPNGMFLIDQHAAHERVMYEKILAAMKANQVDRQPLLDPLVVELPLEEATAFERSIDELRQIGFEIEPFGPQSVVVRAIPALIHGVDVAERLHLILQELASGGVGDSWLDSVAISAACHTSIRAGQALALSEMRELVRQLEQTQQPRACGHGRPTMLHMSQIELEQQFSRR